MSVILVSEVIYFVPLVFSFRFKRSLSSVVPGISRVPCLSPTCQPSGCIYFVHVPVETEVSALLSRFFGFNSMAVSFSEGSLKLVVFIVTLAAIDISPIALSSFSQESLNTGETNRSIRSRPVRKLPCELYAACDPSPMRGVKWSQNRLGLLGPKQRRGEKAVSLYIPIILS